MGLLQELSARGLFQQVSDPDLDAKLEGLKRRGPISAYAGFDPTGDSLHVGNFVAILGLMYAQRAGLSPIAVVGGATGLIGDPSGKSIERQLLSKETVAANALGIGRVLERFLDFHHPTAPARLVSNLDWFGSMSAIDFLRQVGIHFRVGTMLTKDSVRSRMEAGAEGMSYTEFSYQLLQGYDFYRLYKDQKCVLQLGGSDQWGNITAGIDLIRKLQGESGQAFGLTLPLITTASGAKFGKSEGNAVWLSAEKTSPYDFYQFWLRTEDSDVERYLRFFTFLPLDEISQMAASHAQAPEKRLAQKRLAELMTTLVHSKEATDAAITASQTLYGQSAALDQAQVAALETQGVPVVRISAKQLQSGWSILDAAVAAGLAKSKGDAKRLVQQGGLSLNQQPVSDLGMMLTEKDLAADVAIVLRGGKKNYRLIKLDD